MLVYMNMLMFTVPTYVGYPLHRHYQCGNISNVVRRAGRPRGEAVGASADAGRRVGGRRGLRSTPPVRQRAPKRPQSG